MIIPLGPAHVLEKILQVITAICKLLKATLAILRGYLVINEGGSGKHTQKFQQSWVFVSDYFKA